MATPSRFTANQRRTHAARSAKACERYGLTPEAYNDMCRIEQTLSRWHEEECNGTIQTDEATGKPYRYFPDRYGSPTIRSSAPIANRWAGAKRRANVICNRFGLHAYIQTDPRGPALYIFRWSDVPVSVPTGRIDQCYASVGFPCYFPEA